MRTGMHALSPDEVDVYTSLVDKCPTAQVTAMHNHCMSEQVGSSFFRMHGGVQSFQCQPNTHTHTNDCA